MKPSKTVLVAVIALMGVNALWGMSFPVMKSLNALVSEHLGIAYEASTPGLQVACSAGLIALRFSVAMALLTIALPQLVWKTNGSEWAAGFWIGAFFCFGLVLQVIGLASIPASRSGFLTSLTAIYTPLLSMLFLRQKLSWQICVGSVLALCGVAILSDALGYLNPLPILTPDAEKSFPLNWGDLWTTIGALFFSVQVLLVDYFGKRCRSAHLTPGMFLMAATSAWMLFLLSQSGLFHLDEALSVEIPPSRWLELVSQPIVIGLIVFLAIFCSVLSFLGMNTYQPSISAAQASVIYSTEPVFASCWAMVLPGVIGLFVLIPYENEGFTWQLGMGGAFILLANVVALWPSRKESPTPPIRPLSNDQAMELVVD